MRLVLPRPHGAHGAMVLKVNLSGPSGRRCGWGVGKFPRIRALPLADKHLQHLWRRCLSNGVWTPQKANYLEGLWIWHWCITDARQSKPGPGTLGFNMFQSWKNHFFACETLIVSQRPDCHLGVGFLTLSCHGWFLKVSLFGLLAWEQELY
jgi:hypothetical protein